MPEEEAKYHVKAIRAIDKDIASLDRPSQKIVVKWVSEQMAEDPYYKASLMRHTKGASAYRAKPNSHLRIIFEVEGKTVWIMKVDRRGDDTYDLADLKLRRKQLERHKLADE
ncbi:MAG: hypothetical protein C0473_00990 [Cyanobacteria bacterium DS3.002]|nr:hypothetical protein [Cyanobacteria bacterium DS3.002]MBA4049523.1 hypothetical protein [Cyanobacteria bacterium DS2.008]MBA4077166.1 hypothetical protein [Cyanobacteria bacterium PR.023]